MRSQSPRRSLYCSLLLVLFLPGLPAVATLEIWVNTTDDLPEASCQAGSETCSLRAAIKAANASTNTEGKTIHVPAGYYQLTIPGTHEDDAETGDLDVRTFSSLRIVGEEASRTIIDGSGLDRVFDVHVASPMDFSFLTITGGSVPDAPGSVIEAAGGGIRSRVSVRLLHCQVTNNRAEVGGGVYTEGYSGIEDTEISGNSLVDLGFTVPIGAGVRADGIYTEFSAVRSTVANNRCPAGQTDCVGGIAVRNSLAPGPVTLRNSTISGNDGTGVRVVNSSVHVLFSTIVENGGRGLDFLVNDGYDWERKLFGSVLAHNTLGDCRTVGGVPNLGSNLDSDNTCGLAPPPASLPGTDPRLYPLGYYSEAPMVVLQGISNPTPTHVPKPDSPVIDAASDMSCEALKNSLFGLVKDDQDCYERPDGDEDTQDAYCDLGSIEVLPCNGASDVALSGVALTTGTYESCTWMTVSDAEVGTGEQVTLRAREPIVCGNGFSVASDASLTLDLARDAGWIP